MDIQSGNNNNSSNNSTNSTPNVLGTPINSNSNDHKKLQRQRRTDFHKVRNDARSADYTALTRVMLSQNNAVNTVATNAVSQNGLPQTTNEHSSSIVEALQSQIARIQKDLHAERSRRKDAEKQIEQYVQQMQQNSAEILQLRNELKSTRTEKEKLKKDITKEIGKSEQHRIQKEELEKRLMLKLEDNADWVMELITSRFGDKDFHKEDDPLFLSLVTKLSLSSEKSEHEDHKKKKNPDTPEKSPRKGFLHHSSEDNNNNNSPRSVVPPLSVRKVQLVLPATSLTLASPRQSHQRRRSADDHGFLHKIERSNEWCKGDSPRNNNSDEKIATFLARTRSPTSSELFEKPNDPYRTPNPTKPPDIEKNRFPTTPKNRFGKETSPTRKKKFSGSKRSPKRVGSPRRKLESSTRSQSERSEPSPDDIIHHHVPRNSATSTTLLTLKRRNSLDLETVPVDFGEAMLRISKSYDHLSEFSGRTNNEGTSGDIDVEGSAEVSEGGGYDDTDDPNANVNANANVTPNVTPNVNVPTTPTITKKDPVPRNLKRRKRTSVKNWCKLPSDVLYLIFFHAGIRCTMKFARVCKRWHRKSINKEIWPYIAARRAYIEHKRIYHMLVTHGVTPLKGPREDLHGTSEKLTRAKADLHVIRISKRNLALDCLSRNQRHYEPRYIIPADQLVKLGAIKKTLLPNSTFMKTKLYVFIPENCLIRIAFAVVVQGVEISTGELVVPHLFLLLEKNGVVNMDPVFLNPVPFLSLLYNL